MPLVDAWPAALPRRMAREDAAPVVSTGSDPLALRGVWTMLDGLGQASAYQTYGFCKAWYDTIGRAEGWTPLIIQAAHPGGLSLWPLAVKTKWGTRIATFAGHKHTNYAMPLMSEGLAERLDRNAIESLLAAGGRAAGVDVFHLINQPVTWRGTAHPMRHLGSMPSASSAWMRQLEPDIDAFRSNLMSGKSWKKLRAKARKLTELCGDLRIADAKTPDEIRNGIETFLRQRAERAAATGAPNAFGAPAARQFLEALAADESGSCRFRLHAVWSCDRILALFFGMDHANRFTGMSTSYEADPDVARSSPGDLALISLMEAVASDGMTELDLGAGDVAYKLDYCDTREPLFETLLPITAKGRLLSSVLKGENTLKHHIKGNPRLETLARRWRPD